MVGAAALTLSGQWGRLGTQIVGLIVMARLLPPDDFGIVAIVTAIVTVASALGDFGLPTAVIQAPSVTDAQRSNLFWLNTSIGATLTTLMWFCAPIVGQLSGDHRAADATHLVSVVFVINGASAQFRAHLTRDLRFGVLAFTDLLSQATSVGAGVSLALAGWGWRSLAVQLVAAPLVILVTLAIADGWIPGRPRRHADMGALLKFGGQNTLTVLILYASSNIDTVLVGRFWGLYAVGLYQKAYQVVMLPIQQLFDPLTRVVLPILSRIEDSERFASAARRILVTINYVGVAFLALLALCAYPGVYIALGRPWLPMVPIFLLLVLGGVFEMMVYPYSWIFLARAQTGLLLRATLITRPIMVVLIVIGALMGTRQTAGAVAISFVLNWVIVTRWIVPKSGLNWVQIASAAIRPLLLGGIVVAAASPVAWAQGAWSDPFLQLLATLGVAGATAAIAVLLIPGARADVGAGVSAAREMMARRRPVAT